MSYFQLPERTEFNRVIPKNAFDDYTNTKQKRLFTDLVKRISWTHKLAPGTINLEGSDVQEIQVIRIELKEKKEIPSLVEIMQRAIPYHIIFWVEHGESAYISTASKHAHPTNEDNSVIDWTYSSAWFTKSAPFYRFELKESLDAVFKDICLQITGRKDLKQRSLKDTEKNLQEIAALEREIEKTKSAIAKCKQFNRKVELNITLKSLTSKLQALKT